MPTMKQVDEMIAALADEFDFSERQARIFLKLPIEVKKSSTMSEVNSGSASKMNRNSKSEQEKEKEKAAKAAEKEKERAAKAAVKAAAAAAKATEKEREKAVKAAEKEREKAAKAAMKDTTNASKKPPSAYQQFVKSESGKVKAELHRIHGDKLERGAVMKEVGARWKLLSQEEKEVWKWPKVPK